MKPHRPQLAPVPAPIKWFGVVALIVVFLILPAALVASCTNTLTR